MMAFDWIKVAPWLACVVLALMLAGVANAYLGERDDFTSYRAVAKELGERAAREKIAIEAHYTNTFNTIRKDHEKKLPTVRATAVAAYKLRFPASGCPVPGASPSKPVDDGASAKLVVDGTFIQDCSDDAAKLTAWQTHCTLNNCPIKE